jgi:hypothetical protein
VKITVNTADSYNRRYSSPSLATGPSGKILLAYDHYLGAGNDLDPSSVEMIESEDGRTWGSEAVIDPSGVNPSVVTSNGRILVFYGKRFSNCDLRIVVNSEGKTNQVTPDGAGYVQLAHDHATILRDGRIALPIASVSDITPPRISPYLGWILISPTWSGLGPFFGGSLGPDEPAVVERTDGTLDFYSRSVDGYVYRNGSPLLSLPAPDAPFNIRKVGNVLLAVINQLPNDGIYKRGKLTVFISSDEGENWHESFVLENDPRYSFSGPAILGHDGYVIFSYWTRLDSTIDRTGTGLIDLRVALVPSSVLGII